MDLHNPRTQKLLIAVVLSATIGYFYFFSTFIPVGYRAYSGEKNTLEAEFQTLSADLSKARQTLNNKAEVERQYKILGKRWELASQLLPEEKEVAGLLRQVTLVGQQSGVEFLLFKPQGVVPGEVYTEAPVMVKVEGGFHEIGTFLSEVANLERIVNVSELKLEETVKDGDESTTTSASFKATAYTLGHGKPSEPGEGEDGSEANSGNGKG
jgi:type IV pilus assembly protein PilO